MVVWVDKIYWVAKIRIKVYKKNTKWEIENVEEELGRIKPKLIYLLG